MSNGREGKENPGHVPQREDKQNSELFKKRMQHVGGVDHRVLMTHFSEAETGCAHVNVLPQPLFTF